MWARDITASAGGWAGARQRLPGSGAVNEVEVGRARNPPGMAGTEKNEAHNPKGAGHRESATQPRSRGVLRPFDVSGASFVRQAHWLSLLGEFI
jgi:hypothetical protein